MKRYASSKLIAVYRHPDPLIAALDVSRRGDASIHLAAFDPVRLEPDKFLYIRNRAISAEEWWGPNSNFDSFSSHELAPGDPKFGVGTYPGQRVDIDHNPDLVIGTVLDSVYLLPMVRRVPEEHSAGELKLEPFISYNTIRPGDQIIGAWIENVWAVEKEKLDGFYPHATEAVMDGEITDTSMGCFLPGTPITMADGSKKIIEEIKIGDFTVTHTGKRESVIHVMRTPYHGLVYTIKVYGQASDLTATPEHPIWIRREPPTNLQAIRKGIARPTICACGKSFDNHRSLSAHIRESKRWGWNDLHAKDESLFEQWIEARDVRIGDWVLTPAMIVKGDKTSGGNSLARLLGYYLAEGNIGCNKAKYGDLPQWVEWTFNAKETAYHQEVISDLHSLGYKASGPYIKSGGATIRCYSPKLAQRLKELGGKYSWAKQLSSEVMEWSVEDIQVMLTAYWNGDGRLRKSGTMESGTASKILAEQLHTLIIRCRMPFVPPKKQHSPSTIVAGGRPRYWLQGNNHHETGEFLPTRGSDCIRVDSKGVWRKVVDVLIRSYDGLVYNFDVGGDDSYVAADVSVHNCEVAGTRCSVCEHYAESPMEFCQHIGAFGVNKGTLWPHPKFGISVPAYERCFHLSFFEDALILPESLNHYPGSQGADISAKVLQVFAAKHTDVDARRLTASLMAVYNMLPENKRAEFVSLLGTITIE